MGRDIASDLDPGERNPLVHLLVTYGRPYWPAFVGNAVARVLAPIGDRFAPFAIGLALDAALLGSRPFTLPFVPDSWLPEEPLEQLVLMALLIALAGIWSGGVHAIGQLLSARFQQPVLHDIRVDAYDRLQRLAVVVHDDESTGDLMSVLNNDVNNLGSFVGGGIVHNTLKNTSEVVLMLWFVWTLSPSLALLLVVPVVLYFAKAYVYGRVIEPRFTDVRETLGRLNARIQDTIEGITTVKAYGMEDTESERVRTASRKYHDANWSTIRVRLTESVASRILGSGLNIATVIVGGYWALTGTAPIGETVTAGAILAAYFYVGSFSARMDRYVDFVESYENAMASSRRIQELLGDPTVIPKREDATELDVVDGAVTVEDVSFGYDDEPILENVSFRADPGATVGIVGPTGAGKSTLVRHVPRF